MKHIILITILISGIFSGVRSGVSALLQSAGDAEIELVRGNIDFLNEDPCHVPKVELIGQSEMEIGNDTSNANPRYDSGLARKLGADDYGMKSYVLVILKTGTNQSTNADSVNQSFRGHLENINRLVKEGTMIVAGPLGRNEKSYRGIFILNVATLEEAGALLQSDPAIKAGFLDAELYNWYGSAALPEYLDYSDKIWKIKP